MNFLFLFAVVVAGVAAMPQTAVRFPGLDTAIVQSHRDGGNFAYSATEGHAYGVQTPVFSQGIFPVGVPYTHGSPIFKSASTFGQTPFVYSAGGVAPTSFIYGSPSFVYPHQFTPQVYSAFNPYLYSGFHQNQIPSTKLKTV